MRENFPKPLDKLKNICYNKSVPKRDKKGRKIMKGYIWFDMDGTIYDLYKIPNWLEMLRAGDMSVFSYDDRARKSLTRIREAIRALMAQGWEVGVITWAPMHVEADTLTFDECWEQKYSWIERNFPELAKNFYCVEYGDPKANWVLWNDRPNILIDDNKMVRADWRKNGDNFITINAARGYIKELEGLVG